MHSVPLVRNPHAASRSAAMTYALGLTTPAKAAVVAPCMGLTEAEMLDPEDAAA